MFQLLFLSCHSNQQKNRFCKKLQCIDLVDWRWRDHFFEKGSSVFWAWGFLYVSFTPLMAQWLCVCYFSVLSIDLQYFPDLSHLTSLLSRRYTNFEMSVPAGRPFLFSCCFWSRLRTFLASKNSMFKETFRLTYLGGFFADIFIIFSTFGISGTYSSSTAYISNADSASL